jgi:hypothetical protein
MGHLLQNISFTVTCSLLHTLKTKHLKTQILQKLELKSEETQTTCVHEFLFIRKGP